MEWSKLGLDNIIPRTVTSPLLYVTAATVINNLVSFCVQIGAARVLGPQEFGILSLAFSVALFTGTIGELGFNLATIRLFNKYSSEQKAQEILLGSVLIFKAAIFVTLLLISAPFGRFLSHVLDSDGSGWFLYAIAFATGGLLILWTYLQSLFQCYRDFASLAIYTFIYSGLRLASLALAYVYLGKGSLTWLLATYTLPTALLFIIGLAPRAGNVLLSSIKDPETSLSMLKEAFNYSKWVALSGIAYTAMPYVVRFILAARVSIEEVGIFSAGMTFTMAFTTLNTAIRAVIFPQVTALEGQKQRQSYLKKLRGIAPHYIIFVSSGVVALGCLQWYILGENYRAALPVFLITSGVFSTVVYLGLGTMLLHTMMKPQIDAWVNVGRLGLMIILSFILVPRFHALGAAIAYTVPVLIGEIGMFRYITKHAGGN